MTVFLRALLLSTLFGVVGTACARTIWFATSAFVPPYVMEGSQPGLEIDLTRAALAAVGSETAEFVTMSNARAIREIELQQVDGILTTQEQMERVYFSEPLFFFHDVAVSLTSRGFDIRSSADLRGKSIMAFQNATVILGSEFAVATSGGDYEEVYNQQAQVEQLLKGRVDVIVLERRIFLHYLAQYRDLLTKGMLTVHQPFSPIPRRVAFKDEALRDRFNLGLQRLTQSGRYDRVVNGYRDARLDFAFSETATAQ